MSDVKVGDDVWFGDYARPNALEALPPGTVVKDPLGGTRVRSSVGDIAMWTDKGISPRGNYEVIYVPEQPDPVMDLANEMVSDVMNLPDYECSKTGYYYKYAKWILENFTRKEAKPSKIVDCDYDIWYLCKDGEYKLIGTGDKGYATRDEIARDHGIDEEIA